MNMTCPHFPHGHFTTQPAAGAVGKLEMPSAFSKWAEPTSFPGAELRCFLAGGFGGDDPGLFLVFEPVALAFDVDGGGVVQQPVEDGQRRSHWTFAPGYPLLDRSSCTNRRSRFRPENPVRGSITECSTMEATGSDFCHGRFLRLVIA